MQTSITRPINSRSLAGSLFPWERRYTTEPIATLSHNGANLFHIDMSPAASTRLLTSRIADRTSTATRDLDPTRLINRRTTVVRVAPDAANRITAEALQDAFGKVDTDALVLLTDAQSHGLPGSEAALTEASFLTVEACAALRGLLEDAGVDLVLTDLPYLTSPAETEAGGEWLSVPAWQRPTWPSSSAHVYVEQVYQRAAALRDWGPTLDVLKAANVVLGLTNGDRLTTPTVLINIAPLQVADVGEAPCTVVAEAIN